jgi:cytochrome c-type biogenesis protein CcmH/NrfF
MNTARIRLVRLAGAIGIILFCCFAMASDKERMEDVAGRLSCFCGGCPHLVVTDCGCSVADKIKADVAKRLAAGETGDQIVQSYVAKYGQTVLAAPPKSGFNLTAWLIPFLAFGIGGAFLVTFLIKQRKNPDAPPQNEPPAKPDEKDAQYLKRLEKELRQE